MFIKWYCLKDVFHCQKTDSFILVGQLLKDLYQMVTLSVKVTLQLGTWMLQIVSTHLKNLLCVSFRGLLQTSLLVEVTFVNAGMLNLHFICYIKQSNVTSLKDQLKIWQYNGLKELAELSLIQIALTQLNYDWLSGVMSRTFRSNHAVNWELGLLCSPWKPFLINYYFRTYRNNLIINVL